MLSEHYNYLNSGLIKPWGWTASEVVEEVLTDVLEDQYQVEVPLLFYLTLTHIQQPAMIKLLRRHFLSPWSPFLHYLLGGAPYSVSQV